MALTANGQVYTFGYNQYGQLGNNTLINSSSPVAVLKGMYAGTSLLGDSISNPITALAGGFYHSAAIARDGTIYTFGNNTFGQLGD
ncbi:MAG: hypothetical protein IPK03_09810 [Bacteroidetes bacterium]|nr:hypothetical protein [Bacteroidota bacterium]